jgi:predicted nucleic acid-binding protein
MIDLSGYPLVIGTVATSAPPWLARIVRAGKDAAYVDTGYLRALVDNHDASHSSIIAHFASSKAILYTSPLVVAEAARHLAKSKRIAVTQQWRWDRIHHVHDLVIANKRILVCAPEYSVVEEAVTALDASQRSVRGLDLCDALSIVILNHAQHRRVFGFDRDLTAFGAQLEP